jgi:glycosyltransferase involved in cell wall biosynthesis
MRILQVIAGAEHGGAETFFGDFMLAMHNCKNRAQNMVQKAVLRPYENRLDRLEKAGIPLATLPFGSWFDWRTRYGLRQEILDFKPHIVQTWMNRATKFVPPRSAVGRQPYVHVGWLGGYYDMKYYQSCDHIVVLTTDMQAHVLRSGWPKDRLHIVPPFAPDKNAAPINRAEFDTPKDAPLIVTLGRLHVKKAQDILIRAMADVPNAYLWIAGEGELRKPLMALCEDLGVADRVRFLGWRHDREALLRAADLCVFPSRYEPFGVVTLEAWAQKCPLIAAASQGPKSVITHEHDGLVVPVDDVAALVDSIRTILNDPGLREKLIDNGRRTYDTKYSEKSVIDQYLSLYQNLALMGTYARYAA